MRLIFSLCVVTIFLFACSKQSPNKFSDPTLIKIADFQDHRNTDSLILFLKSENPVYRKEAALAFASVQDSIAAPLLGQLLLEDKNTDVRRSAAFALGQTGTFAAVNALVPALQDTDHHLVAEVLEALGKSVAKDDVMILVKYNPTDSLTAEGLAKAFYRIGLRNLSDSLIENKAKEFLKSTQSEKTRLAAAHFFSRTKVFGKGFYNELINAAQNDLSPEVRMASVTALRKITKEKALPALSGILKKEPDYRVRVGAVRGLSPFPVTETFPLLLIALSDKNVNVAVASAELLKGIIDVSYKEEIQKAAREATNWRVQANLYEALLSVDPSEETVDEIKKIYSSSSNSYQRAALLGSLSKVNSTYTFIGDELFKDTAHVIRTSAAQALVTINYAKSFDIKNKTAFAVLYQKAILDGDPGVIGIIANALSDSLLDYKSIIKDFNFLVEAKNKLSLPKDYEALQPLEEALAYFEGKPKPSPPKNEFNHPINWELVKTIKQNQKVLIKTNKGDMTMLLKVNEAPGSVANFVELIQKHYFDNKFFHRVVPNFVIQTGCNRGDGYGSEAYSIRSEFSALTYKTGSVGMASAGKDTEGTQWFITHSPTPHLDGKYTIFAEAITGMNVVDQIEVGDKIIGVTLIED